MGRNKKIIMIICIIIILSIIALYEMFFGRIISSNIRFQELSHYENRSDLLNFISIVVTTMLSYAVYDLSKKIDEQGKLEKKRKRYESICLVYDYLNEIIIFFKKKVFKDKEDYTFLQYNNDFMKEAYKLNNDVFDNQDIELIRNINKAVKDYLSGDRKENPNCELTIKWVYRCIFDLNMKITDIEALNNLVDVDMLLNVQLVSIMTKLRKELECDYIKDAEYDGIKLSIKRQMNTITIEKRYEDEYYIKNGKGKLKIYEPIFYMGNPLYRHGALVYDGEVMEYKKNGKGKYYYCKSNKNDIFLNSYDLIDSNAQRIKKILEKNNSQTNSNAIFIGKFKDNLFTTGKLISVDDEFIDIYI